MSKWKAPENFGAGCSIGGRWFDVVDGVLNIEDDGGDYGTPLGSLGFTQLPDDEQAAPAAPVDGEGAGDAGVATEEAKAADGEAAAELSSAVEGQEQGDAAGQTAEGETAVVEGETAKPTEAETPAPAAPAKPAGKLKKG